MPWNGHRIGSLFSRRIGVSLTFAPLQMPIMRKPLCSHTRLAIQGSVFLLLLTMTRLAFAVPGCPFCGPSDPPYSSRMAESDIALLVTWDSLIVDKLKGTETTTFRVLRSYKKKSREFKNGDMVESKIGRNGEKSDVYLLLGTENDEGTTWSPILITSETLLAYIMNVPAPEAPDRLVFFLKFLENPDTEIANDAYAEFSRAQFNDVAALAPKMPRDKLREWLASSSAPLQVRLGLYGMMLGLSGDASDASFLENLILKYPEPDRPRFGVDGMMAGYVILRGEPGLQKLIAAKFDDPRADGDLPLLKNAIVFLWDYCRDRISADTLRTAMRHMLDRPKWAFGVMEHLARWKDWQSLDRLAEMYGKEPFDSPLSKQQIVEFALVCEKDGRTTSPDELPQTARKARQFLNKLDPEFVKSVERRLGGIRRPANDSKDALSPQEDVKQTGLKSK